MPFEDDVKKIAEVFNLVLFDINSGEPVLLEDREATYFDTTIRPTNEDCIIHCLNANKVYQILKDNPPQRDLDIIDWRIENLALHDFCFSQGAEYDKEVILFKQNFVDSISYFHELLEKANIDDVEGQD